MELFEALIFRLATCTDFTYFTFRALATCFLLRGCTDRRPRCSEARSCVSGHSGGCGLHCPRLTRGQGVVWRCQGGINPYKENIPAGTPCYT